MHRLASELIVTTTSTIVIAVTVLFMGTALTQPRALAGDWPTGSEAICVEAPLNPVSESGIDGNTRLCADRTGLQPALTVRGLHEGEVYTAWLTYFDRPSACFLPTCGFIDLRGDDPAGVLGRVDGAIAPSTRELEFRATLRDLHPLRGAQVTLLVLNHGNTSESDGRARARQLLTPQMFDLGAPMAGAFSDRSRGWLHAQATFTIK